MAPFEALYGRRCRTPINWSPPGQREVFGPDFVIEAKRKVKLIRKNLEAVQARQKSYHNKRRKPLQFEVDQNKEKAKGGTYYYDGAQPYKNMQTLWYHYAAQTPNLDVSLLFMNLYFTFFRNNQAMI